MKLEFQLKKVDKDKLYIKREKHLIYVYNPVLKRSVRFDLKRKKMQRDYKNSLVWKDVSSQYDFFRGYSVNSLVCEEDKFRELILQSVKANEGCESLSTFIARLNNVLVYENFINQGVKFKTEYIRYNWNRGRTLHLEHGLEEYPKNVINFFKETDYVVNRDFEHSYFSDPKYYEKAIQILRSLDIPNEEKKKIVKDVIIEVYFNELVQEYNYDIKALILYLVEYLEPFENLRYRESPRLLRDYYRMAQAIGRNVKKYPKYLKSIHDIILANYQAYQKEYDEVLFKSVLRREWEAENNKYCLINPRDTKDIISEGTSLNHCVSSYVDKIIDRKTYIMFLRHKKKKEDSLITVEVINKKIVQAKGSCNRAISQEEKNALYSLSKKVQLGCEI